MSEVLYLQNVRLSFPHLVEAHSSGPSAPPKFSADFIMEPTHPGYAQFMEQYGKLAQAKWAEHAGQVMQMIHADRKLRCYGAGEEKMNSKTFQVYDGYAGMVFITANNANRPQFIKADGTPVDTTNTMEAQQIARTMYGGCRVNVAIKPWTQENKHGRGIRCDLVAIQFQADDTPFGEAAPDASGFFGATGAASSQAAPSPAGASMPPIAGMPTAPAAPAAPEMPGLPPFLQS